MAIVMGLGSRLVRSRAGGGWVSRRCDVGAAAVHHECKTFRDQGTHGLAGGFRRDLAGFESATRCLEGAANLARMMPDVRFSGTHDPLSTGIGRDSYYKRRLQGREALGPGHPSNRRP
jgi:hypothetical protein